MSAFLEQLREAFGRRPFGRDVEQVELAVAQRVADRARVFAEAGQRGGADPEPFGRADLVVHQRDQRRDDDPGAVPRQRRQLVGQRLARAGRHHRQRMLRPPSPARRPAACTPRKCEKPKRSWSKAWRSLTAIAHQLLLGRLADPQLGIEAAARRAVRHACRARRSGRRRGRRSGRRRRWSTGGGR